MRGGFDHAPVECEICEHAFVPRTSRERTCSRPCSLERDRRLRAARYRVRRDGLGLAYYARAATRCTSCDQVGHSAVSCPGVPMPKRGDDWGYAQLGRGVGGCGHEGWLYRETGQLATLCGACVVAQERARTGAVATDPRVRAYPPCRRGHEGEQRLAVDGYVGCRGCDRERKRMQRQRERIREVVERMRRVA